MKDFKISVIIPVYNRRQFLLEAVNSVLDQSYRNFELVIVDDGSIDDLSKLTDQIKTEHRGVALTYLKIEHCGKPGAIRNVGALHARGEYLAFLDSDDLWMRDKLARQVVYLKKHPTFPLVHTAEIWNRNGRVISQAGQTHRSWGSIFADALTKCIIGPSTVVIKRRVFFEVGMFDPQIEVAEDYDLWLRYLDRYRAGYIGVPLVVKRGGHVDQLSQKYGHIEIFRIRSLQKYCTSFGGPHRFLVLKELHRKCTIYANGCTKRKRIDEAEYYYDLARNLPIFLKD